MFTWACLIFSCALKSKLKKNKQLEKPGWPAAQVVSCNEYDWEESYENEDGQTEWRTLREAIVTFRFMVIFPGTEEP